jgi:hypothetical protein
MFILVWFQERSSANEVPSTLYSNAWMGIRWVDIFLLSVFYFHLLVILRTRAQLPKLPEILRGPAILFLAAVGISLAYGLYRGGSHVFFDWRNLALGIGLALVFAHWIQTPDILHRAVRLLGVVLGARILYILASYVVKGQGTDEIVPGLTVPIFDGPTLGASVLLALLGLRFYHVESSPLQRGWWAILGGAGFMVVLLSLRRTAWGALAIGLLVVVPFLEKRRLAVFTMLLLTLGIAVRVGDDRFYRRAQSLNPFADSSSDYARTNEDHIGDVLDAVDQVKENPILGIGLGRTYQTSRITGWKTESWGVHNGPLHAWVVYGFLGMLAYLWFHMNLFRWLRRLQATHTDSRVRAFLQVGLAFLLGLFVMSLGFSPWPYGELQGTILIFFILGCSLAVKPMASTRRG